MAFSRLVRVITQEILLHSVLAFLLAGIFLVVLYAKKFYGGTLPPGSDFVFVILGLALALVFRPFYDFLGRHVEQRLVTKTS